VGLPLQLNRRPRPYTHGLGGMTNIAAKHPFSSLLVKAVQPWHRLRRGLTLGVRVAVFDAAGRVLLVRHTYVPGWWLPGGGVDRTETLRQAAERELHEEAGIIAEEAPSLHGMFLNERAFPGDHVACFIVRKFRRLEWTPNLEIVETRFFGTDNLPDETTGGSRRRIEEIVGGKELSEEW
jgi:8-oxo-dGTP pyrophosphatase MutT (NUDIX family)